jgi:hypothetical protein
MMEWFSERSQRTEADQVLSFTINSLLKNIAVMVQKSNDVWLFKKRLQKVTAGMQS